MRRRTRGRNVGRREPRDLQTDAFGRIEEGVGEIAGHLGDADAVLSGSMPVGLHPTWRTQTHDGLLDSARTLFEDRGYHAVGLEEVAADAGVSLPTIYLHFGSNEALVAEFFAWVEEREGLGGPLAPAVAATDGVVSLQLLMDALRSSMRGFTESLL